MTTSETPNYEELLARLDAESNADLTDFPTGDPAFDGLKFSAQQIKKLTGDAAAAIRSLQADLQAERKAREEANADCMRLDALWAERTEWHLSAEAALAKCFEETRERCAMLTLPLGGGGVELLPCIWQDAIRALPRTESTKQEPDDA